MTSIAIMQPHYLPWMGYFELIRLADKFMFLDDVDTPVGRSFVNRTKVQLDSVTKWLSIPIDSNTKNGSLLNLRASSENWPITHKGIIENWYRGYRKLNSTLDLIFNERKGHENLLVN